MARYIIRRLLLAPITLLGVVTIVFIAMRLVPGNPIELMVPQGLPPADEQAYIAHLNHEYGFDQPLYVQYGDYISHAARLDFGNSFQTRRPILPTLITHVEYTLQLGVLALLISVLIGIPSGILSAAKRDSWIDNSTVMAALGGVSMPDFVLGFILIIVFSVHFNILPPAGSNGTIFTWNGFKYVILPAIALGAAGAGRLMRFTRSSVLDVAEQDFVRTARAKGLREGRVLLTHVLRNSLIPIVTVLGLELGAVLSGAVVIETVFGWPGVGRYLIESITERDFPVVQAAVLIVAFGFVFGNLITDLTYAWIDPRIRYEQ